MDVKHVANLANLPLSPEEESKISVQFAQTLETIRLINRLNTSETESTYQVTGLVNVTRPDELNPDKILSQKQALSNSPRIYNGFFVVPAVFS